jgi:hypothetical protein
MRSRVVDSSRQGSVIHPGQSPLLGLLASCLSQLLLTKHFVRLETRTACDEVIKRLHGRMVRGRNDPGSRISVRFADSAEQRELRVRIYVTYNCHFLCI